MVSLGICSELVGMLEDDVAPHHHALAVLVAEQVVDAADVPDIDAARRRFAPARSLDGPVPRPYVSSQQTLNHGKGQQRADLRVEVVQQLVGLLADRRQHVAGFPQAAHTRGAGGSRPK